MSFFFKQQSSRIFTLQNDDRYGSVHSLNSTEIELTHYESESLGKAAFLLGSIQKKRIRLFICIAISILSLFAGRVAQLQIVQGVHYAGLAQNNRFRNELIQPARGVIQDRYGNILADNQPTFILTMTLADLPRQNTERDAVVKKVAELVGLQPTDIDLLISDFADRPYDPIPVQEHLEYESAIRLAIEVSSLPGFRLISSTKRMYHISEATSLAHVLGYMNVISADELAAEAYQEYRPIDEVGKMGLERSYESALRGIPGHVIYEVDAQGQEQSIISRTEPVAGSSVTLGMDLEFQKFIDQAVRETLERHNLEKASVVGIDPQTGVIRALVSLPSFDNNQFTGGITSRDYENLLNDPNQPLFPRSISGEFPSGSTFKPFIAYAALAENIVDSNTSFLSSGGLRINEWFFPDWKSGGHGVTNIYKAIAESVNTYFYIIGGGFNQITGLGVDRINVYAQRFGFGAVTGIDIPGENDGFLPTKDWKLDAKGEKWYVGDTYHLAIGQGDFLTTPLQMAVATSMIANHGIYFEPKVVDFIQTPDQTIQKISTQMRPVEELDADALAIVREGMRQTVSQGSARSLQSLSYPVAGKTGTAQTPGNRPYHSWFTGFGPYEDPNLTLVVLVEEGGESNDVAVPLARQIFQWWFENRPIDILE